MSAGRTFRWGLPGALVLALLLCARCAHQSERGSAGVVEAGAAAREPNKDGVNSPASSQGGQVKVDAAPPEPAQAKAGDAGTAAQTQAANPFSALMKHTDAADRELLASVERETGHSPPQAVEQLLALRRSGASEPQLSAFIDRELGADLRVRMAAKRWLREVTGAAAPEASPAPGGGGGTIRVAPIKPK